MPAYRDRKNERYGRLLVLENVGKINDRHRWLCLCDCGEHKIISSNNLSSGKSNSCGCLRVESSRKLGKSSKLEDRQHKILNEEYVRIKRRHKKFGGDIFPFDYYYNLVNANCYYCGIEYSKEIMDNFKYKGNEVFVSDTIVKINGVDRVNSSIGYTKDNTVTCCKECNTMKLDSTQSQFYSRITKIYKNFFTSD